jgi:hypothetical protein
MTSLNTPVVFIIFNRPDLTQIVFEAIRQAQPKQLFVIADGARNETELILCEQSRAVIERVDWNCEVFRNYSKVNLGSRKRVSSGIDWVFEQVLEAIILEDDCLPHPSFFSYCQELLAYYRDDNRIWCISGDNFQDGQWRGDGSYYFSNYNHCWGWATWRRCWQKYDRKYSNWLKFSDGNYLKGILDSELEILYWREIFQNLYNLICESKYPNWDYTWTFTCWQNHGLTALPNVNLISNLGCRSDGTNITTDSKFANLPIGDIGQIHHPKFIARDRTADEYTFDHIFGGIAMKEANSFSSRLGSYLATSKQRISRLVNDPIGLYFSAIKKFTR